MCLIMFLQLTPNEALRELVVDCLMHGNISSISSIALHNVPVIPTSINHSLRPHPQSSAAPAPLDKYTVQATEHKFNATV
mmetsp:Transcript_20307/g.34908  ORF Transcript_20307/g.34908 Transcript_20307/m.34908 type:complete len:80 (+) Transcript_20307:93-332(+)